MEIHFVRVVGQRDRVYVQRTAGGETSWVFPTYGDLPPHDLVHLVVEAGFGVPDGFWGRVEAGVDVVRINAEANRRGGADKYAAMGEPTGLLLAEALAAAPWFYPDTTTQVLHERITGECQRHGIPLPARVTLARIDEVRAVLERLRGRWKRLVPKGTLVLHLSRTDLEGAFQAFAPSDEQE